jgi:hypothetical protein
MWFFHGQWSHRANINAYKISVRYPGRKIPRYRWMYDSKMIIKEQHLHLVPRSKNEWTYTCTPQYAFMAWCSVKAQGFFKE